MKHPDYPNVSSLVVKGNVYWRFRKTGMKPVVLPGEPHTAEFDAAYQAAIAGKAMSRIIRHGRRPTWCRCMKASSRRASRRRGGW